MTCDLSTWHLSELKASAIDATVIVERGYRTVSDPDELPDAFAEYQRRPGLLIPIRDTAGEITTFQLKADIPRIGRDGKPIKYETAAHGRQSLDVPQRCRRYLGDPSIQLVFTEGPKKVDSALSNDIPCVIGLQGVYGFRAKNEHGGVTVLPDFEAIALNDREVVIAFDSDCMTKDSVRDGLDRLGAFLQQRKARVRYIIMPDLPEGSKCGLDDWFAAGRTVEDLATCMRDTLPATADDWHDPMPLDDMVGPPFPLAQLPGPIGEFVEAVAEETQTPPDLPATVALATISAAAGGKYQVVIPSQGWTEPVHIQTIAVAEPANRKTAIFRYMTAPIGEYERAVRPEERKAYAEWESRRRALEQALSNAERLVDKPAKDGKVAVSNSDRMRAVTALEEHLATPPRITRIIADDVTPEAAKGLLADQGGALAVMSGESAFLANIAGQYSDAPNLDVLLKGHAGDAIRVNRRGRPEETVDRACLTLCLMVQPRVVGDLGKVPGFKERGGPGRLLPSFPADLLGQRRIDVTPVPSDLATTWETIITKIVSRVPSMQDGSYLPWTLSLDADALALFREYRAWHEPHMGQDGAFADIRDWAGKQCGAVLRIAGLLHIAIQSGANRQPEDVDVCAGTLARAIAIVSYYEQHARIMYRVMRGRSSHADARAVLGALRTLDEPANRRALHRKLHNRTAFAVSADLSAPLDLLEDYGWIRRTRRVGEKGGRPSERIFLNPAAKDDKSDKTPEGVAGGRGSVGFVIDFPETQTRSSRGEDPFEKDDDLVEEEAWSDDDDPFAAMYEAV